MKLTSPDPVFLLGVSVRPFTLSATTLTVCTGGHVVSGGLSVGCGPSTGSAFMFDGHLTTYTTMSTMVVFSGGVTGVLNLTPAVGQSCLTGVTTFLAHGGVVLL